MTAELPHSDVSSAEDTAPEEPSAAPEAATSPRPSGQPAEAAVWSALRRGWARRCPRCGEDPLFARFFTLRRSCDRCRLAFEVDPGDTWALWLIGDRVFIGLLIIAVFLVFRSDSWTFGLILVVATVVPLIWTMPHRMGVCIAVDYLVRSRWGDLADPLRDPPGDPRAES